MADANEIRQLIACGRAFSPSAPINLMRLFKGRKPQLESVIAAITTRGSHIVLFGDRGVGKTSLANIIKDAMASVESLELVKVNCNEADTFYDVWRRALSEIETTVEMPDGADGVTSTTYQLSQWLDGTSPVGSGEIKKILKVKCSDVHELVIVFDEFDRLENLHRRLFADTIKDLSDSSVNVTVMIVGVANDVSTLIDEHASISRCLSQIFMPPMANYEIHDIIDSGLRQIKLKIVDEAKRLIVNLSRGYPYYTHLLTYEAAVKTVKGKGDTIQMSDLAAAVKIAIDSAHISVREDYLKAADGQRKNTKFPIVLLASALAKTDDMGYFKPTDLKPISPKSEPAATEDYTTHLNKLATDDSRGTVLERAGVARRYKYRFKNPLLRPFIILKGVAEGLVRVGFMEGLGSSEKQVPTGLFDDFD